MSGKPGRSGRYAVQRHDAAYWTRLRAEFKNCSHENSGAYCASAAPEMRRTFLIPNAIEKKAMKKVTPRRRLDAALKWNIYWED